MALVTRAARGLLRRRSPLACLQQGKSTAAAVQLEEDEDYAPEITVTRTRPEAPKPERQPKPYRSVADDAAVRAATQAWSCGA